MISNLISPKLGMGIIKNRIESQKDIKVKDFCIKYNKAYENLQIEVLDYNGETHYITYSDESGQATEMIASMIKAYASEKVKSLDFFNLKLVDKKISCDIYFVDETNTKLKSKIEL